MNLEATDAEVLAVAEVLKLSALLDDRAPRADKSRIAAWAEQIHRHHFTEPVLLDAVQAFYDSPSDHAIQIGDLIQHAKQVRRDLPDPETRIKNLRSGHLRPGFQAPRGTASGGNDQCNELPFDPEPVVIAPLTGDPSERLEHAKAALQTVTTHHDARQAITQYFAARRVSV
jgi:hypothetical protein